MKTKKRQISQPQWLSVKAAARRYRRSPGQIARRCLKQWEPIGLARKRPGVNGRKWTWQVRSDALLKRHKPSPVIEPIKGTPIATAAFPTIHITISINVGFCPTIPTPKE